MVVTYEYFVCQLCVCVQYLCVCVYIYIYTHIKALFGKIVFYLLLTNTMSPKYFFDRDL